MSRPDYVIGTGTIIEPSPYADEDEQREAEALEQIEEMERVERQWAAYVAARDDNAARNRS